MPIATPEKYAEMLDAAKSKSFAFPAINVSSSQTLNAALAGFSEAGSDGIIQVSTGGAEYLSGPTVKDMVTGSVAFAAYALEVAKKYPVNIALHTDHCPKDKLDGFVRPLLDISRERVKNGQDPLFQSHMWDGSAVPLEENLEIAQELLAKAAEARIVLEVEIGVVGGEEDGVEGGGGEQLYSTTEDALATVAALGTGENGRYLTALTFGNVHGVYKPGNVKLRPEILKKAQDAVVEKLGLEQGALPFDLVFHGGSGSTAEEIAAAVDFGVIKMNVDTDTQYAFTRPVAGHMFANYDGVLKIDGEVGNKKTYDPRAWGKAGEAGMAARVAGGLREPAQHRPLDRLRLPCVTRAACRPREVQCGMQAAAAGTSAACVPTGRTEVLGPGEREGGDQADHEDGPGEQHRLGHRVGERGEHLLRQVAATGFARREVQPLGSQSRVHQHRDRSRAERRRRPVGWRCRSRRRRLPAPSAGCAWRWPRSGPR